MHIWNECWAVKVCIGAGKKSGIFPELDALLGGTQVATRRHTLSNNPLVAGWMRVQNWVIDAIFLGSTILMKNELGVLWRA